MEAAEIEKELEELATKTEELRALYEQYFMGFERIEPTVLRKDVERRVKVLRREQLRNTAQRFKFNTLVQRLNTMQQYWARVVREIENGTFRRDVIRAAARFGEGALTALGQKKTKKLLDAVASASAKSKRPAVEDALEISDDDLIEDEEDAEAFDGEATVARSPTPRPAPAPVVNPGLWQDDLPVIGVSYEAGVWPAAPPPTTAAPLPAAAVAAQPAPRAAAQPAPAAAVAPRAGAADPASMTRPAPVDPKRRVAELAADARRAPKQAPAATGFGQLDIDLDDAPSGNRPAPAAATPAARTSTTGVRPAPFAAQGGAKPAGSAPAASRPAAQGGGFGMLDMDLDGLGNAPAPAPAPKAEPAASPAPRAPAGATPRTVPFAPGAAARPAAARPPAEAAASAAKPAAAASPARPAAAAAEGELSDARIRQIYAKYVETKRAASESTAGVTYEKLATSLRAQADKLKAAHPNRKVDYEVVLKDGKTHLKPVLR